MNMYNSYAAIYEQAGQGRFGERMAEWSLAWLAARGQQPHHVLDLACGTGAASLVFARFGCEVVGVDQSASMLEIARAKTRDQHLSVEWAEADIRELALSSVVRGPSFDLVTCFADSVNYLVENGDLERVFDGVAQVLRSGGWFIFDMNSEAEYKTWDERDVVAHDSADLLVFQKLRYNNRTRIGTGRIGWFVREIDRWWRGEEEHHQRAWREAEVREALAATKLRLELVEPVDGVADGRRMVYVVQKL